MKRTILYLLAVIACASAAPVPESLSPEAEQIVDSARPLTEAAKIAKMIRIIASRKL